MQVLVIFLESHGKLRLLPDGTRGIALKDEMHGVIHYPLCASCACAINESYRAFFTPKPMLPNLNLVKLVRTSVESCLFSRQSRVSLKPNPTPPPPLKPFDFQSIGA
ncbi:hypothetical protein HaLaN_07460 [Haematococcus lacustris]|uniref:Uncharacterized protein n=1 Tax=Haematococcus lacustris TaxID=44745 RepID=A0A699Z8M1_HAELA|nr:hypothetical protein HaLaN_07460 [Haematococcus lacustris]